MQADLAVFAGDPLDPSVPVQLVVSQGKIAYQAEKPASIARWDPQVSGMALATGGSTVRDAQPGASALPLTKPTALAVLEGPLPESYALRSSRCWTENGKLEPRTILVKNGQVVAVHVQPSSIDGATLIDVGTAVITPGLINGHSDLGFARAIDEPADADASYLRAVDAFDSSSPLVRRSAKDGVLGVALAPGSTNLLAGCVGMIRPGAIENVRDEFLAGKPGPEVRVDRQQLVCSRIDSRAIAERAPPTYSSARVQAASCDL
jgi:hypothetical protein